MYKIVFLFLSLLSLNTLSVSEAAAAPALPMASNPDGIAVMDFKSEFLGEMEDDLAYFKEKCGYALETNFVPANLSQGSTEEDRHSVSGYCSMPLTELVSICEKGESYKAIVASKIKKFSCRFLGSSGKRSLELSGSDLIWSYEYETEKSEGYADYITKTLQGLL